MTLTKTNKYKIIYYLDKYIYSWLSIKLYYWNLWIIISIKTDKGIERSQI